MKYKQSRGGASPGNLHNDGHEYTPEEVEFMRAIERFKKDTGTRFPSFADVLMVAKQLGYRKVDKEGA